jgi:Uncharacterised nucleotidyltransferase
VISKDIDWTYLLRIARAHGVMPFLYRSLNSTCSDAVPKLTLEELRDHFYANAGRNLFVTKELLRILDLLQANEIPAIPYKGPVLAASVYRNLAFREFGDLDILVHEREYSRTQHLLVAQGYRLTKEFDWESTFVHGSGMVAVDLHRAITAREFSSPLNFEYLSGRLQRVVLASVEVPNLSPEDTLLMLAIQIAKDTGSRYFRLVKICDVAELLHTYPHLDLAQGLRQARKLGGERMLLFTLLVANNLLDAAVPQRILSQVRFHSGMDELLAYTRRQLFAEHYSTVADQPGIHRFRWLVRERVRDKIYPYYLRYVADVILPCELDRRLLPLSKELSFLYYFIRPVRLIGKHGLLQIRRSIPRAGKTITGS